MKLLVALRQKYPHLSQTQARALLKDGLVRLNHRRARLSDLVKPTDTLEIPVQSTQTKLAPNPNLGVRLLHETPDFLWLEKPAGLHAVAQNFSETESVANALLHTHPELAQIDPLECGLAHRLDFETSGVMVAAKTVEALAFLRTAFAENRVRKDYVALVSGQPQMGTYTAYTLPSAKSARKTRLSLTQPLTQNSAKTLITRILSVTNAKSHDAKHPFYDANPSRVQIELVTGYRHQIRAHLALLGFPLCGDTLYDGPPPSPFFLHAEKLSFEFAGQILSVTAPCPF